MCVNYSHLPREHPIAQQSGGYLKSSTTHVPACRDTIIVVSGIPRSGTSMMMQMLYAGGIELFASEACRPADHDNPRGYQEHFQTAPPAATAAWLRRSRGKAVKIPAPLLPSLPAAESYAVILMHRDAAEVVASQRAVLARLKRIRVTLNEPALQQALERQLAQVESWLSRQMNIDTLKFTYAKVLAAPAQASRRIAGFLGRDLDVDAMAQAVAPELRHHYAAVEPKVREQSNRLTHPEDVTPAVIVTAN